MRGDTTGAGVYICGAVRAWQREADAGNGNAPRAVEGHGLLPGRNDDCGGESFGGKRASRGSDGRGGGLRGEGGKHGVADVKNGGKSLIGLPLFAI